MCVAKSKGTDQLRIYCKADLRLCFCLCRLLVFPCSGSYIVKLDHLGSMNGPCYIQNRAVMNRVIKRSRCILRCKPEDHWS